MDTSGSDYYQGGPGPNIPALMDMPFQGGGEGAEGGGGAAGPMGPGPSNFCGKSYGSFSLSLNVDVFLRV